MAFGTLANQDDHEALAEINMVPLIDVMLVLLVIFIITAPLLTHAVKVELPRASSALNQSRAEHIDLAVDELGRIYWNGGELAAEQINAQFALAAQRHPQPELHLRAARATRYEKIAELLSGAARAGLTRVGFVTDPRSP